MASRTLQVNITGDPSSFKRTLRAMDDDVKKSEGRLKNFSKVLGGVGLAAGAGAAVGLKKVAEASIEAEKSQARMVTQLRASDVSFRRHAAEIDRVIQKHSQLSGLDDEDLQDAFTNIVRITGDVDKGLRLTGLAADFARAKHVAVAKAGELVAKVAGGNTGILSRYGIQIEKGASATEALGILQQKFAGQAEAYGKTTQGALDRASVASENLQEIVGAKLTPILAKAATGFVNLVDRSRGLAGPIRTASGAVRDAYDAVVKAVRRFAERNREDIRSVVDAARNLARFFRNVFEDVIVPVVKRVLPVIQGVADGIVTALRGLIRIVTGIINGDWTRVWDGFKDIARGAVKAFKSILEGAWKALRDGIKALVPLALNAAKDVGKAILDGVVSGIKSAPNAIGNALKGGISGAVGIVNPFGEGIGRRIGQSMGASGLGGGALMGADPDLGPFAGLAGNMGLRTTSGIRPGAVTASGNQSYHATGDALDVSGPPAAMKRFASTVARMWGGNPRLAELIYSPLGYSMQDGQRVAPYAVSDHFDHVHVAYTGPFGDGLGRFSSTAYGPPWNAMNGTGVTATGVDLRPAKRAYGVAVDPSVIPLGTKLRITPNPFGYSGLFTAFDTGGAIKGKDIDFYDWRGRAAQFGWGTRTVSVSTAGSGGGAPGAGGGGGSAAERAFNRAQRAGRQAVRQAVRNASRPRPGGLRPSTGSPRRGDPTVGRIGDPIQAGAPPETPGGGWGPLEDVVAAGPDPAVELANRLAQERIDLDRQLIANQRQIIALANQGPQILAAVIAAIDGGIGGPVGLGYQTVGYAGAGARY